MLLRDTLETCIPERVAKLEAWACQLTVFNGFSGVQSAFPGCRVFPPPAAGADVFAQADGAGAGGAADAGVELVVQGVVGDLVLADVGPDFLFAPVGQGVEFFQAMGGVETAHRERFASGGLLGAHAGDPGFFPREGPLQGFHFAYLATGFA